ncbi:hypothetical protein DTO169E5_7379 [Paecilomyces variotii]|nr:hypothetical protein DTO169C6_7494 [Paecilomyces variotii]KAJ9232623.1 hypothetical protein DTO169E5_7379 [Paecilomyces variotii]KAJ9254493.1 hypothetical protein DTO195F2_6597 [Paecilomyces variotii]
MPSSTLSTLRLPRLPGFPNHYRYGSSYSTALTIASASLLTAVGILCAPAAYRDYKKYMSYGPGGPPYNVFGWLAISLLAPLQREMLDTAVYDQDVEELGEERTWLKDDDLPQRKGPRPEVGTHAAPQRQLTQTPETEIKEKLLKTFLEIQFNNQNILNIAPSNLEKHTSALFISDLAPRPNPLVTSSTRGEIAHVHGTAEHSVHVILSPVDSKKVIEAGWGQRHSLSGSTVFRKLFGKKRAMFIPNEFLLIYAPRDEEEIKVVINIVKAAVAFGAGVSTDEVI